MDLSKEPKEAALAYLMKRVREALEEQERKLGSEEVMNDFMRVATLRAIDDAWVEQVDFLQQLQSAVSGRSFAQRNPLFEYRKEALESFNKMKDTILKNIVRNILLSNVYVDEEGELRILFP